MKKLLSAMFYGLVLITVLAGLSQVFERQASAEGGGCCSTSADCPGKQLCYANTANCCTGSQCVATSYCEDKRAD